MFNELAKEININVRKKGFWNWNTGVNGVTEQPYTNKHGRPDVPPDETTFTIHGTIKGSAALKEYFRKRSTQKRATPNNSKNDNAKG